MQFENYQKKEENRSVLREGKPDNSEHFKDLINRVVKELLDNVEPRQQIEFLKIVREILSERHANISADADKRAAALQEIANMFK